MAEHSPETAFEHLVEVLVRHGVEFVVIGGQAGVLYGCTRPTFDLDICYKRIESNLECIAAALSEIGVSLRNAPPDLPFRLDARSLALGDNFTFDTPHCPFDLLGWVEPLGKYEDFSGRGEVMHVGPYEVLVISIEDLIEIKEYLRRPKDIPMLQELRAIKAIRDKRRRETS